MVVDLVTFIHCLRLTSDDFNKIVICLLTLQLPELMNKMVLLSVNLKSADLPLSASYLYLKSKYII